jgi:asparagine synthase (glutamine-hydrolysing)
MASSQIRGVALEDAGFERVAHWHERHARALGVDVRHPYLDKRLFEYVLSLPPDRLFDPEASKPLLRQAVAGLLPEPARLRREKPAFDRFLLFSLEQEARKIDAILRAPRIADWGFVDASRLRAAWKALRSGTFSGMRRTFWFALTLELWLRQHQDFFGQASGVRKSRMPSAA